MNYIRLRSWRTVAFTLIELLIVVAIIAILAAIAVPNFLEAQTRGKIARVKSDMRTLATAIESYRVDYATYPPGSAGNQNPPSGGFRLLTRPIAYVTNIPFDPFDETDRNGYEFATGQVGVARSGRTIQSLTAAIPADIFILESIGADGVDDTLNNRSPVEWGRLGTPAGTGEFPMRAWRGDEIRTAAELTALIIDLVYDPTNGSISSGGIWRHGGHAGDTETLQTFTRAVNTQ
jgi:type II secretion system protein G